MKSYIATNGSKFYALQDEKAVERFLRGKNAEEWQVYMRVPIEANASTRLTKQLLAAWVAVRSMIRRRNRPAIKPAETVKDLQIGKLFIEEAESNNMCAWGGICRNPRACMEEQCCLITAEPHVEGQE